MIHEPEAGLHPDAETLAAFAEGRLERWSRTALIEHLDRCADCMHETTLAIQALGDEPRAMPRRTRRNAWIAAAAAIVVVAIGLVWMRDAQPLRFGGDPIRRLVAVAPQSARSVEPRLNGGFAWAAYHGAARAGDGKADAARYRLAGVAGEIVERAKSDPGADAQHAAGVALVLMDDPTTAIRHLELAARARHDGKTWSDLAAARYAAAADLGRPSLYPEALAAADAALRVDADQPEALFNRALILERMGLLAEARGAWMRYLEVDPSSAWANEARTRLRELPATTHSSRFGDADMRRAALAGDAAALRMLIDRGRGHARAVGEAEYLGLWGEAFLTGDDQAANELAIARALGAALREASGESLLHDAVAVIDAAGAPQRRILAEAHAAYRRGRIAYSRQELAAAGRDLLRAAGGFEETRSPMALMARYYAASVRLNQDVAGARVELEQQLAEAERHPHYLALGAAIRWELGRIGIVENDAGGAVAVLTDGIALYRRAGEPTNAAFLETMLATALLSLGRADDGWAARIRAFGVLSREGAADLLATSIGSAIRAELLAERREGALALLQLDAGGGNDRAPANVIDSLVARAMLEAAAGAHADALATVQRAREAAAAIPDPELRARWMANIGVAAGAGLSATDSRAAADALTRSIAFYRTHDLPFALVEPLLLRARCAMRGGDADAAARDLEEGMVIVERHAGKLTGGVAGTGVLRAEHALFDEAIGLALDRGDTAGAFAIAERAHGAPFTVAALQQRLRGSDCAVLRIVTLPDEAIIMAVDEDEVAVARRKRPGQTLAALAAESLSDEGTAAAAALYDDLIRPVEAIVAGVRQIIIVADRRTASVPWAALYDTATGRHLIERVAVATASRAGALAIDPRGSGAGSVTVVALPAPAGWNALADSGRELADVAAAYPRAFAVPRHQATFAAAMNGVSDVVHIAGHTERQPVGGEQALLFAAANGTDIDRVTAGAILSGPSLRARVVVLAACETLRHPASTLTRSPSLGEAFAASGAEVVGTLTPIGDRDARRLFAAFHRQLARGATAADALRAVQRMAIEEQREGGSRSWRAVALLTTRIPRKES